MLNFPHFTEFADDIRDNNPPGSMPKVLVDADGGEGLKYTTV